MKQISFERLRELQLAEKALNALEATGVDNWEGYSIAMETVNKEQASQQERLDTLDEIMEVLSQGVDYPAGREAGAYFKEDVIEQAQMIILGVKFN